ncbi:unnamed protein product [Staurois parvus]|uniref:Uncharacterized protein n=1 Tax=Staurois parvus TaxID=386267 RepID=A0ABN9DDA7_9NEOB|nr:unnamed protein product [Staurois parvus]
MVGVTSQGSEQEKSAEVRIKQGQQQDRNRNAGTRYRAHEKHTHQGKDCRSGHHLNTPA